MVDLSFINENSSISAIDANSEARYKPRLRLGLSQIGHKCARYLWYKHNGYAGKVPGGRILRLFQLGNILEEQLVLDLKSAGFNLHSRQKHIEFTQGDLKLKGSCDGIISGLLESGQPHLWECKTVAEKGFKKFKAEGYEKYSPQYKAQIHCYAMGLKLSRIFVTVYNKNTSELYAERIKTDKKFATERLQRAFQIITMNTEPERSCPHCNYYEAKWCDFMQECWNGKPKNENYNAPF